MFSLSRLNPGKCRLGLVVGIQSDDVTFSAAGRFARLGADVTPV